MGCGEVVFFLREYAGAKYHEKKISQNPVQESMKLHCDEIFRGWGCVCPTEAIAPLAWAQSISTQDSFLLLMAMQFEINL